MAQIMIVKSLCNEHFHGTIIYRFFSWMKNLRLNTGTARRVKSSRNIEGRYTISSNFFQLAKLSIGSSG